VRVPLALLRRSRWAGLAGIIVSLGVLGLPFLASEDPHDGRFTVLVVLTPIVFWMLARSTFSTLAGARAAATTPEFERQIDLFDLRPHFVAGRTGLRLALVWLTGTATSVMVLPATGFSPLLIALNVGGIAVAVAAFLMPVRQLQHQIRASKRVALDLVQRDLAPALEAHARGEPERAGHLADLLALRAHLENVREWPFDNTTLRRFALYTLLPLGSWIGGALVERIIALAIG
jgi:hypothetical protein